MLNKISWLRSWLLLSLSLCATSATLAQDRSLVDGISLPDGFSISVWTDRVPNARSLALGESGTVFVSTRSNDKIYAVIPREVGEPDVVEIASGLRTPNGIDLLDGDLFVAETERLLRFPDIEQHLNEDAPFEVVADDFPPERHHGWRYIRFGPDGKLYMSVGAPCNVCDRDGFATILRMNPDGSNREVWASGVRNSVGLEFHPVTGELWFTDNGRDMLGDDLPPGELNHAPAAGAHFGFPFCHAGVVADPEFGGQRACSEFRSPAMALGPHVAPLGLQFYDGDQFPEEYRGDVFIAEHGSWNRSERIGYRVTRVRLDGPSPSYEVFASGWLKNEQVSGRPVDLLILADGSMLVSDDHAGRIYRITYTLPGMDSTTIPGPPAVRRLNR